eukprot:scaffold10545_cov131-Isochrysis_galbana.AAC.6
MRHPPSHEFSHSDPSRQSGMVQPVVQEMFATVHAAGSSLLGLFSSCTTFDSTPHHRSAVGHAEVRKSSVSRQGHRIEEICASPCVDEVLGLARHRLVDCGGQCHLQVSHDLVKVQTPFPIDPFSFASLVKALFASVARHSMSSVMMGNSVSMSIGNDLRRTAGTSFL